MAPSTSKTHTPKKPKKGKRGKLGRPSTYTEAMADRICALIADRKSVHKFAGKGGIPQERLIYRWLDDSPEFCQKYTRARSQAADKYASDVVTTAEGATRTTTDLARIKIDAYKWAAGKFAPKKYGDKVQQEHTGAGGSPLFPTVYLPENGR